MPDGPCHSRAEPVSRLRPSDECHYRMTARAAFKQDDLTRAIKGVRAAGLEATRIEIEGGRIVIMFDGQANLNEQNPLDRLHAA